MIRVIILVLTLTLSVQDVFSQARIFKISGKVTRNTSYCGGPAPSEEMIREHAKHKPYPGKTFYVKQGKTNSEAEPVILSFKSDKNGNFIFELPPGIYSIIQFEQTLKPGIKNLQLKERLFVDTLCYKKWWTKPYLLLEVKDKPIENLNFKFYHPCGYINDVECIQYMPPPYP
jgi:hypothetical protein